MLVKEDRNQDSLLCIDINMQRGIFLIALQFRADAKESQVALCFLSAM